MRVAMIGTGYVGLVSGACFADFGHHVTCVDKNDAKIEMLRSDMLVERNMREGRLDFASDLSAAVREADVVFIAVGTPSRRGDGHADLSYVYAAAEEIARMMDGFTVVVTKSTVPVGTGDKVRQAVADTLADAYERGIGAWDRVAIQYGYQDFPEGVDEEEAGATMRLRLAPRRAPGSGILIMS